MFGLAFYIPINLELSLIHSDIVFTQAFSLCARGSKTIVQETKGVKEH